MTGEDLTAQGAATTLVMAVVQGIKLAIRRRPGADAAADEERERTLLRLAAIGCGLLAALPLYWGSPPVVLIGAGVQLGVSALGAFAAASMARRGPGEPKEGPGAATFGATLPPLGEGQCDAVDGLRRCRRYRGHEVLPDGDHDFGAAP